MSTQNKLPGVELVWTKSKVIAALQRRDRFCDRALEAMFARQTDHEQMVEAAVNRNRRGFSAGDAKRLSSIRESMARYGSLTQKQRGLVAVRLEKYWKQLLEITAESGKKVSYNPRL